MKEFNTISYFANLFAMIVFIGPLYYLLAKIWIQKLILISLSFYLLGISSFPSLYIYLNFWFFIWLFQNVLGYIRFRWIRPLLLFPALFFALLPMVTWKLYPVEYNSLIYEISKVFFKLGPETLTQYMFSRDSDNWILVGISFATFRAIDLLIKTNLGNIRPQSLLNILTYGFFPPIQIVGPIVEYHEISGDFEKPKKFIVENLVQGLKHCVLGLAKIYILAYPLRESAGIFLYFNTNPAWIVWAESIFFAWFLYLNFAGFTDLAVGFSRLFGFQVQGNFNFPFFKTNLQLFWANWHMSLTRFAQRNIFVPMGGYRKYTQYLAIATTMMVIALWHNLSISMVIFGVYHGIGLCIIRYLNNRRKRLRIKSETGPIRYFYMLGTFIYVMLSFPLLKLPVAALVPFYLSLL